MKTSLSIAGSDCSGGAGIQADLKTMTVNGVYAMSAITALTAQNTIGVTKIMEVTPDFLAMQLDAIFTDIRPDSVKVGMVASHLLINTIADKLLEYHAENIVIDPVMIATSGAKLLADNAISAMKTRLLPLATIITPNIPEAEALSGAGISTADDMISVAQILSKTYHCNVLCKGGHNLNDANDLFFDCSTGECTWFYGKRIDTSNTHGTGCTLSSAIAANLAKGQSLFDAITNAKFYISKALEYGLDLGKGNGPMNHAWMIKE